MILDRTNALPLPGLTCMNSTTFQGAEETSMLVPTLKSLVETVPARTVRTPRDAGVALGVGKKRGWVSLVRVRFHGTSAARRYDDDVGCGGGKGAGDARGARGLTCGRPRGGRRRRWRRRRRKRPSCLVSRCPTEHRAGEGGCNRSEAAVPFYPEVPEF